MSYVLELNESKAATTREGVKFLSYYVHFPDNVISCWHTNAAVSFSLYDQSIIQLAE